MSRSLAPHEVTITDSKVFHVRFRGLSLGQIELSQQIEAGHRDRRTPQLIRQSDPEHYLLGLIKRGHIGFSRNRTDVRMETGDVVLWDTSHPYVAAPLDSEGTVVTVLSIPRAMFSLPANGLDAALGSRFTTRRGLGALYRQFLTALETNGAECSPEDLRSLEQTALSLASGLLAQQLNVGLPPETRQQVMLRRIDAFIDHHLADPQLSPRSIAARHNISLRGLYALFDGRDESVASSVRRRRLERCRTDLADPGLRGLPIHAIAARWGFASPSTFAHAFRQAFGTTPVAYRSSMRMSSGPIDQPPAG
ncbi:helix-turn-helix domain-containing protein [Sinosporangium siamense]|uniref:AraC-like ligand-binding domain-containing protein n=1 Tax=Sinosporangium siamense TaxID=1367973 RepID=UPI0035E49B99